MSGHRIHAVVVTYHPDELVLANLAALRAEQPNVVVVDNGSSAAELAMLREASHRIGFHLIENGRNLGIATALNIGIRHVVAASREADAIGETCIGETCTGETRTDESWVLLFDQDSRVTAGFAQSMLRGFLSSRWGDRLGLLVPRYQDLRYGRTIAADTIPAGGLEVAMTSGSLLRLRTFVEQGLFVDELFIDAVDHEFSLRLRRAGYTIDECPDAVLLHSPGSPRFYKLFGWRFQTANYSPVRRYYQERNKLWIYREYFGVFPRYCRRLLLVSVKDLVKLILLEEGKTVKIAHFLRGIVHGLRGRWGPMPG